MIPYVPGGLVTLDPSAAQGDPKLKELIHLYQHAWQIRTQREQVWRQIARYMLPYRAPMFGIDEGDAMAGLWSSDALHGCMEFSSRMVSGLAPYFQNWLGLKAGWDIPAEARPQLNMILRQASQTAFQRLELTNFTNELDLAIRDAGVGTAFLLIEDDDDDEVRFVAEPPMRMCLLDGPDGEPSHIFKTRTLPAWQLPVRWPQAPFGEELRRLIKDKPAQTMEVVYAACRDYSAKAERWGWYVFLHKPSMILDDRTFDGVGSCPWAVLRWWHNAETPWGTGPIYHTLPDARTLNLLTELTMQGIETSVIGMWQYDDDGVVNPSATELVPGVMIPRAPGSRIDPLMSGARVDLGMMSMEGLELKIKRGLYLDRLGPENGPVKSATEIMERQAELARVIGSPYARIQRFLRDAMRRYFWLLKRRGVLRLPLVDGKLVRLDALGPFARAQRLEEVMTLDNYLAILTQRFGPEFAQVVVKAPELAQWLAEQMDVPLELIKSPQEVAQAMQLAAQAAQQMQQGGAPA